jgi:NAD(P)-dependent dehydrogenase (short-subunit alcohol dehydrogenase family)
MRGVRALGLNVTKPQDIAAAVARINQAGGGLYGLVNNAGVVTQLVELNEGEPYTYDRAALVRMLDEALVGARPRTH